MNETIPMLHYSELLEELENNTEECHLLLGNGFNCLLDIKTGYKSIFSRMKENESIYGKIESEIGPKEYNIEQFIGSLRETLKEDKKLFEDIKRKLELKEDTFPEKFIEENIRLDFMKAASGIVREKVSVIYKEKNQGLYRLFEKFSDYFTLNYDTFLYLLLMKFKKTETEKKDSHQSQNDSYEQMRKEIKRARKDGVLTIRMDKNTTEKSLQDMKKTKFHQQIEIYSKVNNKNWKVKDIAKVCDQIWKEENSKQKLENIDDGFRNDEFIGGNKQNIFFLHGSFHIYKEETSIKKITQTQGNAMHERLEKIIDADEKDVVCVFTDNSEKKVSQIKENNYLKTCLNRLSELQGKIVIFGSSLAENDAHIFKAIQKSKIEKVYISSCKEPKEDYRKKVKERFPDKKITLFDYETVSYDTNDVEAGK